jgi:hypothetical protein
MAEDFTLDFTELIRLGGSLAEVQAALMPELRTVVAASAKAIQDDTRDALAGHSTWPGLADSVTTDMAGSNRSLAQAVVGFEDREGTGPPWIHEFGSVDRSPHPTLFPAATRQAPEFEKALAEIAAKVIEAEL